MQCSGCIQRKLKMKKRKMKWVIHKKTEWTTKRRRWGGKHYGDMKKLWGAE